MQSAVSVRAPLRVSLGGGGTDLPSHYREHGGFVVSAAIDRYVRIRVAETGGDRFRLHHLELEEPRDPAAIAHPILRAAVRRHWNGRPLDLRSDGDVAPGTGLGSSGAYTVCAVKALELAQGRDLPAAELAEAACEIEMGDVGRSVGKQDQYAAAFGGANAMSFARDGRVEVRPLALAAQAREALAERFLLFYTGEARSASQILSRQVERARAGDPLLTANLDSAAAVARETCSALEAGRLDLVVELMNEGWRLKAERLRGVSSARFEQLRAAALRAGAQTAMLTGAGGGGHLLAYAPEPDLVRDAMRAAGAPELPFGLDERGCVALPQ